MKAVGDRHYHHMQWISAGEKLLFVFHDASKYSVDQKFSKCEAYSERDMCMQVL